MNFLYIDKDIDICNLHKPDADRAVTLSLWDNVLNSNIFDSFSF